MFTMLKFLKQVVTRILTMLARLVLAKYKPKIIAITGSVGKTSTKDAVYAALTRDRFIRKSEKSLNSELGVPLTILGCESGWRNPLHWLRNIAHGVSLILFRHTYPEWLVLEVGADRPGDIRSISRWLRPDIAIITGVPDIPVHVEYFDSPEAVAKEKGSMAEYLKPGGKLLLNGDDMRMQQLKGAFRGATLTYGFASEHDFVASHDEILYEAGKPEGMQFRVNVTGSSVPVVIRGALGTPRIYAATAALAVAQIVGIDLVASASALATWEPPTGRMRLLPGVRGSVLIDDTYNSSPIAALAALDTLRALKTSGKKIALMADMMELGKYSADAHRTVGERAAQSADMLITVGFRSRAMGEAALDAGLPESAVREYEQHEAARAGLELEKEIKEGDIILIKGSQSMRMERAVEALLADPLQAGELLVRQDEEWKKR